MTSCPCNPGLICWCGLRRCRRCRASRCAGYIARRNTRQRRLWAILGLAAAVFTWLWLLALAFEPTNDVRLGVRSPSLTR